MHYATYNWQGAFYGAVMPCHLQEAFAYVRGRNNKGASAPVLYEI